MNTAENENNNRVPEFDSWMAAFFDHYYRRRPVNATFIGVHEYDDQLPDLSEDGIAGTAEEMRRLLDTGRTLPERHLTPIQRIDKRLVEGFLRIQLREFEGDHFWRANPSLYTGEAIFAVLSLFLTGYAPLADRVEAATMRLQSIPGFLDQARANLRVAPTPWIVQALVECRGALAFLSEGATVASGDAVSPAYLEGVALAASAFADYRQFLESGIRHADTQYHGCGEELLDLHLSSGHFLDQDADGIADCAEDRLAEALSFLAERRVDFGASDPGEVERSLELMHADIDDYYPRYQRIRDEVRRIAEEQSLLTWPDFPIRYVPQPAWVRAAAPDLYFLPYRSPAAFARPPVHEYFVTPIDETMPDERQEQLLRSHNDSVIRLNHVVHHGGIGHHVQNWHAYRSPSQIGRIAAIDCACRIAMNCGGSMAEGWACYASDLIAEAGGLSARERYVEQWTRARMCARAIVDVRLHRKRLTFDEAVEVYVRRAGMGREAAVAETTRNSMFPGSALMYLSGCDAIHELRARHEAALGTRFNLRDFHDRFLSYGSVPVSLIAAEMARETGVASAERRAQ